MTVLNLAILHFSIHHDRIKDSDRYREKVFANLWQECNNSADGILEVILRENRLVVMTQRDATIAATLVQWLGTNIGQEFLYQVEMAKIKAKKDMSLEQVFLDVWAEQSLAPPCRNEYSLLMVLLTSSDKLQDVFHPDYDPISEEDINIAKMLIAWLGSEKGQLFLNKAKQQIAKYNAK